MKRVFAGFYKRYDGTPIYVVDVLKDIDTGEEIVVCKYDLYSNDGYYVITKQSFCEDIVIKGEAVPKYKRANEREKIGGGRLIDLAMKGFRKPTRREKKEDKLRNRRQCKTYLAYAKDICEWYQWDLRIYRLCVQEKKYVGVDGKEDFAALSEDLKFLKECLNTVLKDYSEYFRERFMEKKSIRKYAEAHNLNRGSVDYIQKKFFKALAECLENRDKADGKKRIIQ